jgi:hypothetical protein
LEEEGLSNTKESNIEEAIKNLLILLLLKEGVNPKAIEIATGIPEMTIRGKYPMKLIKKGA